MLVSFSENTTFDKYWQKLYFSLKYTKIHYNCLNSPVYVIQDIYWYIPDSLNMLQKYLVVDKMQFKITSQGGCICVTTIDHSYNPQIIKERVL